MKSKVLKFRLTKTINSIPDISALDDVYRKEGKFTLNSKEWRGYPPRTCCVRGVKCSNATFGTPCPMDLIVEYRPKGFISYVNRTRYDGWTLTVPRANSEGVLVNGKGEPIDDGETPAYDEHEVHPDIDFNTLDFGEFISEVEVDQVKRTTLKAIHEELVASGKINSSIKGSFTAGHRHRPLTKIVISTRPTAKYVDGFGTHISVINIETPQLEQVLMDEIRQLMYAFIEGRASVKNQSNDDMTFVELSDALVDVSTAETGHETWFEVLNSYTPVWFLEDLAKRLTARYAITVEMLEGKQCGLVLRHETD